ncbi:MAG: nuclear transport factor 2 family protein [Eudoraea sp.]|nr:nuclear transport factor 2 family protein [Eudoraea sp.]
MEKYTQRDQLIELANKMFIYTDEQDWELLQKEVFKNEVHMDMSSLGGPASLMTALEVCEMWKTGLEGVDFVNHLAGNYLVSIKEKKAEVFAYATATHFKETAKNGRTREFVGKYKLGMVQTKTGWRINRFVYTLKYMSGNITLE